MDKEKTGKMIRQARIDKGYTQSELGDMIGVSNKAISRWENGETFPDIGVIEPLAQMLELRIQDIITGTKDSDQRATTSPAFPAWGKRRRRRSFRCKLCSSTKASQSSGSTTRTCG